MSGQDLGDRYARHLSRGWSAVQQGRFDVAAAEYRHAMTLAPARYEAWAGLAECEFAARRPEAALAAWDEALRRAPDTPLVLCGKARVHRSLGRTGVAGALYAKASAIDPECVDARLGLAGLHVDTGALDLAAAALAAIPEVGRARPDVL